MNSAQKMSSNKKNKYFVGQMNHDIAQLKNTP